MTMKYEQQTRIKPLYRAGVLVPSCLLDKDFFIHAHPTDRFSQTAMQIGADELPGHGEVEVWAIFSDVNDATTFQREWMEWIEEKESK